MVCIDLCLLQNSSLLHFSPLSLDHLLLYLFPGLGGGVANCMSSNELGLLLLGHKCQSALGKLDFHVGSSVGMAFQLSETVGSNPNRCYTT